MPAADGWPTRSAVRKGATANAMDSVGMCQEIGDA